MDIRSKLSIKVSVLLMTLQVIFNIDHIHAICSHCCCLADNEHFIECGYELM